MEDMKFIFVKPDNNEELLKTINKELKGKNLDCFYMVFKPKDDGFQYNNQAYIYRNGFMKYIGKVRLMLNNLQDFYCSDGTSSKVIFRDNLLIDTETNNEIITDGNVIFYRNLKRMLLLELFYCNASNWQSEGINKSQDIFDSRNYYLMDGKTELKGYVDIDLKDKLTVTDYIQSATLAWKPSLQIYRVETEGLSLEKAYNIDKFCDYIDGPDRVMFIKREDYGEINTTNSELFQRYNLESVYKEIGSKIMSIKRIHSELSDDLIQYDRKNIFRDSLIINDNVNDFNLEIYKHFDDHKDDDDVDSVYVKIISLAYEIIKNIKNNTIIVLSREIIQDYLKSKNQIEQDELEKGTNLFIGIMKNIVGYYPEEKSEEKKGHFESACICVGGANE
ncbi:hypothetical protein H3T37_04690 [Lactobacillus sp. M0345]|nr:hypothetical protein [Lactobacillus sp. M0345]